MRKKPGKSAIKKVNPIVLLSKELIEQRLEAERFSAQISRGVNDQIVYLSAQGMNHSQIAKELNISTVEVSKGLVDGLDEYYADRDDAVKKYLGIASARYARLLRTWFPLAEPRTEIVVGALNERVEVVHPPDPEAARIVAAIIRDMNRMMGLNKVRMEHTGKDGGKIEFDHSIDWSKLTEEQLAKFQDTNDVGILQAFSHATPGESGAGDPSATG